MGPDRATLRGDSQLVQEAPTRALTRFRRTHAFPDPVSDL